MINRQTNVKSQHSKRFNSVQINVYNQIELLELGSNTWKKKGLILNWTICIK